MSRKRKCLKACEKVQMHERERQWSISREREERCPTLDTTVTALQRHAEKKTKAKIQICRKPGFPESVTNKTA